MDFDWKTLDRRPPRVIAHRGASGLRPEHTLAGYELAIDQGADLIEPDLVVSRDGVLYARHDRGLKRSTDVARRHELASRLHRFDDGGIDWLVDELDASAVDSLRAIQPQAGRSRDFDGRYNVPRFTSVLDLLDRARASGRRELLAYPELKHPREFAARGLDIASLFVQVLNTRYPNKVEPPVWLQCFDRATLDRVRAARAVRTFWLLDEEQARALTDADLTELARDGLSGLGIAKGALIDERGGDAGLVARAHAANLEIHTWTYRDDRVDPRFGDVRDELRLAFDLGVDAVFADFPATALTARAQFHVAPLPS